MRNTGSGNGFKVTMNIFDRYYKKYDNWYDKHGFAFLTELAVIKKVLPEKGEGLEIGVGTGRFAHALGIHYGVDTSKRMLGLAEKRGIFAKLASGEELPFSDSTFDYAVIINTLCFTKSPLKVLREARRVLKKNGKIIVGIIDKNSFLGRLYKKKKSIFYRKANFLSTEETATLLKNAGFNRLSYYQGIYKTPDRIKSVEVPLRGFGRGGFVVISALKKR